MINLSFPNYEFRLKEINQKRFIFDEIRKKYIEFGGDGIYAAWQLIYNEPCFKNSKIGWGRAPVAEWLQRRIMQFTCNQSNEEERQHQPKLLQRGHTSYRLHTVLQHGVV